jgi:predicted glycosyltransferase
LENFKSDIWIDLDNSPHVPFFAPIIDELERRGHRVQVTARDRYQVDELATMLKIPHTMIGRDYGKNKVIKVLGLLCRACQLLPWIWQKKPTIALSHGSRSQVIACKMAGIPSVTMIDYEFVRLHMPFFRYDNIFIPDAIRKRSIRAKSTNIWNYPGIKEDVYVPGFEPTEEILADLGVSQDKIVVTIRPPAVDAHYHNVKSEKLYRDVVSFVAEASGTVIVMLPRNGKQSRNIRETWPGLLEQGKLIIPQKAVNGLDLTWASDLVISGGGTMIREAAALRVPAYSIFMGETGGVDRYLSEIGRLKLIKSSADLPTTIKLEKRNRQDIPSRSNKTLYSIVDELENVIKLQEKTSTVTSGIPWLVLFLQWPGDASLLYTPLFPPSL